MVSEARTIPRERESEGESNHPENASFTTPCQGVLPRQCSWLKAKSFGTKCIKENAWKLHGTGHLLGMLRLRARPAAELALG
jgi:hypothetical protein